MGKRVALVPHFTTAELAACYKATLDAATDRRWQVLWLVSTGKTHNEAATLVGVSARWASALIARYNARGAALLANGRHTNPGHTLLLDEIQAAALARPLRACLKQ